MIYKNSELKQIVRFLKANKKDWLNDEQQEGEPYKINNYGQILNLVDQYFHIKHKSTACVCIKEKIISNKEANKIFSKRYLTL